MREFSLLQNIGFAAVFSLLGGLLFGAGFYLFDRFTPYKLWKELIEEHNTALAIVVGSVSLGLSIIIASAIH
jgi:uncharacterized membrane protein YjfL (UPF0719 family)